MPTDEQIIKKLDRLERLVEQLIDEKKKPLWVKVSRVIESTGWNREELRRARNNHLVKVKVEKGKTKKYFYDLNSIDQRLLKSA